MPAPGNHWFRFHVGALNSRKVRALPLELFRMWVDCMCLAREHDDALPSVDDIAFELRQSLEDTTRMLNDLVSRSMLDRTEDGRLMPHDWHEWQYGDGKSKAAERQRRYRDAKRTKRIDPPPPDPGQRPLFADDPQQPQPDPRPAPVPVLLTHLRPARKQDESVPDDVIAWWQTWLDRYPRQEKLDTATQTFISLWSKGKVARPDLAEMDAGLDRYIDSEAWAQDDGKWIPLPHVFLNGSEKQTGRMWLDKPKVSAAAKAKRTSVASSEGDNPYAEWVPSWESGKEAA